MRQISKTLFEGASPYLKYHIFDYANEIVRMPLYSRYRHKELSNKSATPLCHPRRKHLGHGLCQPCYLEVGRALYFVFADPKDREKAYWIRRDRILKRLYGVSLEEAQTLLKEQGGRCAICRRKGHIKGLMGQVSPGPADKQLVVDHCHKTGKVRGLLCPRCNHMVGGLDKLSRESVILAAKYVGVTL